MTSTDENIKMLSLAVLSEAREDAEQILGEAQAKAAEIRKQAQAQAAAERAKTLELASAEAERVRRQAIAIAQLKARTVELEQREKLIENVFATARQKLASVPGSDDYQQITQRLLREALSRLGVPSVRVRVDEETQKILTNDVLEKVSAEMNIKIQLGEPLRKGTGVIVETEDGRRQYDNTLETRLKRLQDTLRGPVYHLLMGENL